MHTPDAKELSAAELKTDPIEWLERRADEISKNIMDYNVLAKTHGMDRIVAFRMTEEDYMAKMKEEADE